MKINGDAREFDPSWFPHKYKIILADPPWWYADQRKVRKDGKTPTKGIGACHHYDQMKTDEICAIDVKSIAAPRCMLFLWTTCPLLPDAMRVLESWKFKFCTIAFVWVKLNPRAWLENLPWEIGYRATSRMFDPDTDEALRALDMMTFFGPGYYTGSNVELVLLARRGRPYRHGDVKGRQVVYAPRGEHSAKPERVQDMIDAMYPQAPKLEMFARRQRPGWDVFGNEV